MGRGEEEQPELWREAGGVRGAWAGGRSVLAPELWAGQPCLSALPLWAPLQLTVRFWGAALARAALPCTQTCAHMPRHARTQTGTRVIICDAGRPAPVMVLSGRRAAGQADPLPPEKQILGRGCPDAQVMNPSSRRSPPHFLITERRYSALRSLPAGRPQARGRRAGGSVGRDLLLPGRASPSRTHSGTPAGLEAHPSEQGRRGGASACRSAGPLGPASSSELTRGGALIPCSPSPQVRVEGPRTRVAWLLLWPGSRHVTAVTHSCCPSLLRPPEHPGLGGALSGADVGRAASCHSSEPLPSPRLVFLPESGLLAASVGWLVAPFSFGSKGRRRPLLEPVALAPASPARWCPPGAVTRSG